MNFKKINPNFLKALVLFLLLMSSILLWQNAETSIKYNQSLTNLSSNGLFAIKIFSVLWTIGLFILITLFAFLIIRHLFENMEIDVPSLKFSNIFWINVTTKALLLCTFQLGFFFGISIPIFSTVISILVCWIINFLMLHKYVPVKKMILLGLLFTIYYIF